MHVSSVAITLLVVLLYNHVHCKHTQLGDLRKRSTEGMETAARIDDQTEDLTETNAGLSQGRTNHLDIKIDDANKFQLFIPRWLRFFKPFWDEMKGINLREHVEQSNPVDDNLSETLPGQDTSGVSTTDGVILELDEREIAPELDMQDALEPPEFSNEQWETNEINSEDDVLENAIENNFGMSGNIINGLSSLARNVLEADEGQINISSGDITEMQQSELLDDVRENMIESNTSPFPSEIENPLDDFTEFSRFANGFANMRGQSTSRVVDDFEFGSNLNTADDFSANLMTNTFGGRQDDPVWDSDQSENQQFQTQADDFSQTLMSNNIDGRQDDHAIRDFD